MGLNNKVNMPKYIIIYLLNLKSPLEEENISSGSSFCSKVVKQLNL